MNKLILSLAICVIQMLNKSLIQYIYCKIKYLRLFNKVHIF